LCGEYEGELDILQRILRKDASDLGTRVRCINLLTRLGRYEEALRCHGEMPRPPAMTYMVLGSLSEDFMTLRKYREHCPTTEGVVKLMEDYRAGKGPERKEHESRELHLSLL
jgi:hypothetical protein